MRKGSWDKAYAAFAIITEPRKQRIKEMSSARANLRLLVSTSFEFRFWEVKCLTSRATQASSIKPPIGVPRMPDMARVPENAREAAVMLSHKPNPTAIDGPNVLNPMTAPE
jgi:hypothetical protein